MFHTGILKQTKRQEKKKKGRHHPPCQFHPRDLEASRVGDVHVCILESGVFYGQVESGFLLKSNFFSQSSSFLDISYVNNVDSF